MRASGAARTEMTTPRAVLLRRPRAAPNARKAAAVAGSGRVNTDELLDESVAVQVEMVDELDVMSADACARAQYGEIAVSQLARVAKLLRHLEEDLCDQADLIVAAERHPCCERGVQDGVRREAADRGLDVARLDGLADRERLVESHGRGTPFPVDLEDPGPHLWYINTLR